VLKPEKQKQCFKVERWKYKMEHRVKEVKIITTLYSISHCQK